MKIKKEHYDYLCKSLDNSEKYCKSWLIAWQIYKRDNLSLKRFCFDVMYIYLSSSWISDNLYSYMNDEHLYMAIKKYMKSKGIS